MLEELALKINNMLVNDNVEPTVVFEVLRKLFVFWLSVICIDCRRATAHEFQAEIPTMLGCANQFAAATQEVGAVPLSPSATSSRNWSGKSHERGCDHVAGEGEGRGRACIALPRGGNRTRLGSRARPGKKEPP